MTVAITAASGRLGHAILRRITEVLPVGDVIGVARSTDRIGIGGVQRRAGDYQSVASMTAALAGTEAVVMISAPVVSGTDRVLLHRNVIAAARAAGVRHLLYTSVIGNPGMEAQTLFGPTQQVNRQAEADLAESGLAWTVLRNGLYLELDCEQLIRANETGVYSNPAGEGRCGYITIDELAFPYPNLLKGDQHHGKTYNLVGPNVTQSELCALANRVFGLNIRYEPATDEEQIQKFLRLMPQRGLEVARMLTGAFQCIRNGAFEVPSHFDLAAGRPVKTTLQMMEDCRRKREQTV
jgi:NAD(P)H dehydrogenase (quinone)